jgi:hypothetical protein
MGVGRTLYIFIVSVFVALLVCRSVLLLTSEVEIGYSEA